MSKLIKTDMGYAQWIQNLKARYRFSQIKAATQVNREMLRFYWSLGRDIVARDAENRYGSGFYENLCRDLKEAIPEASGFSRQNLQYMKKMYLLYDEAVGNCPQLAGISEGGNCQQLAGISQGANNQRLNDDSGNCQQLAGISENGNCQQLAGNSENGICPQLAGISQDVSYQQLSDCPENCPQLAGDSKNGNCPQLAGKSIVAIPWGHHRIIIDRYFAKRETKAALFYVRKVVEEGWSRNVLKSFIDTNLHLRQGKALTSFARWLPLPESELAQELTRDPYIFDFTEMTGPYKERDMTAVNHILKKEQDNPTIGLLICKDKDNVLAQYALESSSQPIGVAEFQLTKFVPDEFKSVLPSIEEIELELKNGQ